MFATLAYIVLSILAGMYISFVRAGSQCPNGNCEDVTLKSIVMKGVGIGVIAPFYMFYKIVPLFKRFSGNKFDWLDF